MRGRILEVSTYDIREGGAATVNSHQEEQGNQGVRKKPSRRRKFIFDS